MKRVVGFILILVLLSSALGVVEASDASFKPGDYIELGTYQGQSIKWQLVDFDTEGYGKLLAVNRLTNMAFDAAESGVHGQVVANDYTQAFGSNTYKDSNLLTWLNSQETSVTYVDQAPIQAALGYLEDIYENRTYGNDDTAPGFLNGFTSLEKAMLEDYQVQSSLTTNSQGPSIGLIDADNAALEKTGSQSISAKVHLPSISELYKASQVGIQLDKTDLEGAKGYYWLRTPSYSLPYSVYTVDSSGALFRTSANYSYTGVVPMILVDLYRYPVLSGLGTASSPYILDSKYAGDISLLLDQASLELIRDHVSSLNETYSKPYKGIHLEAMARSIEEQIMASNQPYLTKLGYLYVLKEKGITLHRRLYTSSHLLMDKALSDEIIFTDADRLTSEELEAVNRLVEAGIINGYEDGSLRPTTKVSRAEFAKMLTLSTQTYRKVLDYSFKDMKPGVWYYDYVESAKLNQLINGYEDGTFRGDNNVTLDEMTAMVSRVLQNLYGHTKASGDETIFGLPNGSRYADWASSNVYHLKSLSILTQGQYLGDRPATRMEVMILIDYLLQFISE